MPNPLARIGTPVQSKAVAQRPEPIAPIPESVQGDNNPYRGLETHGVPSSDKPSPPGAWADNHEGFTYVKPERAQDPVPVEIVNEYGKEYRRHRILRASVDNTRGIQLFGRNDARTLITIKNRSAANSVFIYHEPIDPASGPIYGWEIAAGESLDLHSQAPMWAVGQNASFVTVQSMEYYSVQE